MIKYVENYGIRHFCDVSAAARSFGHQRKAGPMRTLQM